VHGGPIEVEAMLDLRPKWTGAWHLRLFRLDGAELVCQEEQPEALLPFNGWRRKISFFDTLPQVGAAHYELRLAEGVRTATACTPALPHHIDSQSGLVDQLDSGRGAGCLQGPLLQPLVVRDDGDAWGTDCWSYREVVGSFACVPGSARVTECGPVRNITEAELTFGRSRIVYHTIAYADWPVLEFRLRVQWNEERRRLKLAVPTRLTETTVLCEIPGGAIRRPADGQEHVQRRWLILSGKLDGHPASLALVSNGPNGYDCLEGEVRISLLRSAAYCHEQGFALEPRPLRKFMDQGEHEIRLLVTVGEPDAVRRRVTGLADWLTAPPPVYAHLPIGTGVPAVREHASFLHLAPEHIRLLACRPSADGTSLIVRLQETAGESTNGELAVARGPKLTFTLQPWEIRTLRLERGGDWREVQMIWET